MVARDDRKLIRWEDTGIQIIFPNEITLRERHRVDRGSMFSRSNKEDFLRHIEWVKLRKQLHPEETMWDQVYVMGRLAEELRDIVEESSIQ